MPIIEVKNLTKTYKGDIHALHDVSFSVDGGVFGLLGHNGAGKTTLMKALVTILKPSSGSLSVCGYDTQIQGDKVRPLIGYLPQELSMYSTLSVADFVAYIASLKGISDTKQIMEVLELVDMAKHAKRRIGQLSGGMRRRVGIAQALVGNPQVLVVDEPTAGLDPEERVRFRGVLSRYAKDGRTIVLSTHIVEDVYQLCEHLAVLRRGKLFFHGASDDLMGRVEGKVKTLRLRTDEELIDIQKQSVVISTAYEDRHLLVRFVDEWQSFPMTPPVKETLEDAYVYCMGGKDNA